MRDLHILHDLASNARRSDGPLVLVQERDGIDQCQVFGMEVNLTPF
ncbi:hypothetical protein AOT14_12220 [Stenotrophomonas acidaminiphila]|uniref:Uncharacterized protein n=1 Tax=Stenotrophomonas acidaminiphila TaxID=128780 RepID=A0A0S1AXT9_9GAMM|nr:hypothetical protein AOT14_12220 [Stenotrophomonas acidaminiphila]